MSDYDYSSGTDMIGASTIGPTTRPSPEAWNVHKKNIINLYIEQCKTLKQVQSYMTENHHFSARYVS